jgi:hypothetical protein
MTPGVFPSGLFWTMEIPRTAFRVWNGGRRARLKLDGAALVDSIEFASPIGLASLADIDIAWRATSAPVSRGKGNSVAPTDPGAFLAEFSDASCRGDVRARRTGFSFTARNLDESGFYAAMGYQRNGVFLP